MLNNLKTIKQRWQRKLLIIMKQYTSTFASQFKMPYAKKMGGTQTIVMPDGERFYFDDRDYYKGKGAKYNNDNMHHYIGEVIVTQEQADLLELELEEQRKRNEAIRIEREREAEEKRQRLESAKKAGIYNIVRYDYGTFVELSDEERLSRTFDAQRLANTLNISESDCELLKSEGKTYVYATTKDGNIIELYHSDLSMNHLSISVNYKGESLFNKKLSERESWVNAPFAKEVGQTEHLNHFVC